jgi:8-oxo-dGTP diphosphatase
VAKEQGSESKSQVARTRIGRVRLLPSRRTTEKNATRGGSTGASPYRTGSSSQARPTVEVAAGLIFREGKVLITQRYPEAHLGGCWEFPGGKRHAGETFQQCLARELREELDIEVEVGDLFESVLHEYPEKTVQLEFFLCRWLAREPRALGCAALAWVGPHELRDYEFPAADARLLQRLRATGELWRA